MANELDRPYSEFFAFFLSFLAQENCRHCRKRGYEGFDSRTGYVVYCRCLKRKIGLYHSRSKGIQARKQREMLEQARVGVIQHMRRR